MPTKEEIRIRLEFWQAALQKLRAAYIALVDGGVQSYTIDNRSLTRFDLPSLLQRFSKQSARLMN